MSSIVNGQRSKITPGRNTAAFRNPNAFGRSGKNIIKIQNLGGFEASSHLTQANSGAQEVKLPQPGGQAFIRNSIKTLAA
jgi:hypothetical protein